MKASKFSEAQIAFVLKQAEGGTAVGKVCRKACLSATKFFMDAGTNDGWRASWSCSPKGSS